MTESEPSEQNDQNLICTHDFVLWNGNVECHNCDQIWVYQPTVDPEADTRGVELLSEGVRNTFRAAPSSAVVNILFDAFDAEVAKRREAERQRDHLIAVLDESHALIQRLRAAIKQSMDESGCAGCIAKNMPCPPCEPLAAALDREGEANADPA